MPADPLSPVSTGHNSSHTSPRILCHRRQIRLVTCYLFAVVIACAALTASAQGGNLTTAEAKRFITSMSAVSELSEQYDEALGKDLTPVMGERFAPFSAGTAQIRSTNRDAYQRLADIAEQNDFSDVEHWAQTGDLVVTAYLAIKVGNQSVEMKQMRQQMTPEMMNQMPASMRRQIEAAMAVIETIEAVPPENIAAIEPVVADLEAAIGTQIPPIQ